MKAEIFVLRCFGPPIQKTQCNMEEKNKVDRLFFISFNFKFFQRSRFGDVRKQEQQQSPPSYFNGGCQKHNHSFLSLTLALFKSMC